MRAFHSSAATHHDPSTFLRYGKPIPHPESIARYEMLIGATASVADLVETPDHGMAPILDVHAGDYVDLLQSGFAQAVASQGLIEEVMPTQFAPWSPHRRPVGIAGRLGYHMTDTSTILREGTWRAVYGAAQAAIAGADALASDGRAYALCRPPGHHASSAHAGGFCYLNNAAIAAQRLASRHPRVAIFDIDVHHGNGTQEIFYGRSDVLFVSVHAETSSYFPYFSGYEDEIGQGEGKGANLNLPLALGSGDREYCDAVTRGLQEIAAFDPSALVISLGLDAAADDPIGALKVSEDGFVEVARSIAHLGKPTVLVQEGGYPCEALARNLTAFLRGFEEAARLK